MKQKEIDKVFTDKVRELLDLGFTIHTDTMSGSQSNQIARVDFIKNNPGKLTRVVMTKEHNWHDGTTLQVIVGVCDYNGQGQIIWNKDLNIIESKSFKQIADDWFVEAGEFYLIKAKRESRQNKRLERYLGEKNTYLGEKAAKIVLPFARRQYRCKSVKASDIRVCKTTINGKTKYYVLMKGNRYYLK